MPVNPSDKPLTKKASQAEKLQVMRDKISFTKREANIQDCDDILTKLLQNPADIKPAVVAALKLKTDIQFRFIDKLLPNLQSSTVDTTTEIKRSDNIKIEFVAPQFADIIKERITDEPIEGEVIATNDK